MSNPRHSRAHANARQNCLAWQLLGVFMIAALVLTVLAQDPRELSLAEPSATAWDAPFKEHIGEYLDPAWASKPPKLRESCSGQGDYELEGYINGKLIVVSADTRKLLYMYVPATADSYGATPTPDPNQPGPPLYGLPFADTHEEVGTVVLVWSSKTEAGTYWDGATGYREDWSVKLIDFEKKAAVGDACIPGLGPPGEKSGDGDVTGPPPWDRLMAALRARLFATPFQPHLSEYLDPEWTDAAPAYPYLSGQDTIRDGILVVSVDTGQVMSPLNWQQDVYRTEDPGPPDWGLPFAHTPEQVGTLVLVWADKHEEWTWPDGSKAYGEDWYFKVIDLETRTVLYTSVAGHQLLARAKSGPCDQFAGSPWPKLMRYLQALLL